MGLVLDKRLPITTPPTCFTSAPPYPSRLLQLVSLFRSQVKRMFDLLLTISQVIYNMDTFGVKD